MSGIPILNSVSIHFFALHHTRWDKECKPNVTIQIDTLQSHESMDFACIFNFNAKNKIVSKRYFFNPNERKKNRSDCNASSKCIRYLYRRCEYPVRCWQKIYLFTCLHSLFSLIIFEFILFHTQTNGRVKEKAKTFFETISINGYE